MSQSITKKEQHIPEQVHAYATIKPLVDIYENEKEYLLFADFPGVSKENLQIEFHQDMLTLQGKRQWGKSQEEEVIRYHRSFKIQRDLDLENIKADLTDGVLSIHLPKAPELQPRQIEIQTS